MKVFFYSTRSYDRAALQPTSVNHELFFTERSLSADTVHLAAGCQAVSLFTSDDASAPVLDKLYSHGIRYVLLRSAGYDHVDLVSARSLGIRVANVPEYSPYSVAEHAVALLLALNRKLIEGQRLMDLQDFRIDSLRGFDIHGKTAGVIGTGKIGLAFSRIMLGFGARVVAFDPQVNQQAVDMGVTYVSLEELLKSSDIVSLHCPLNKETKHMISDTQFSWMKMGAIIINTSRGGIINTDDLIITLDAGRLGGAGLDVYEFEKGLFFEDHRSDAIHNAAFLKLRSFKNVLITGHQGFLTEEAVTEIAQTTIDNINCFESHVPCHNELTDYDCIGRTSAKGMPLSI